eukprot:2882921-Rhodomonas_salina.2
MTLASRCAFSCCVRVCSSGVFLAQPSPDWLQVRTTETLDTNAVWNPSPSCRARARESRQRITHPRQPARSCIVNIHS